MAVSIHWFRKALRLHDNPALLYASKDPTTMMIPLFILDPQFYDPEKAGVNRIAHLLETLQTLDENLKKKRSRLFIVEGTPSEVLPAIIKQFDAQILTFEIRVLSFKLMWVFFVPRTNLMNRLKQWG